MQIWCIILYMITIIMVVSCICFYAIRLWAHLHNLCQYWSPQSQVSYKSNLPWIPAPSPILTSLSVRAALSSILPTAKTGALHKDVLVLVADDLFCIVSTVSMAPCSSNNPSQVALITYFCTWENWSLINMYTELPIGPGLGLTYWPIWSQHLLCWIISPTTHGTVQGKICVSWRLVWV